MGVCFLFFWAFHFVYFFFLINKSKALDKANSSWRGVRVLHYKTKLTNKRKGEKKQTNQTQKKRHRQKQKQNRLSSRFQSKTKLKHCIIYSSSQHIIPTTSSRYQNKSWTQRPASDLLKYFLHQFKSLAIWHKSDSERI